MGGLNFMGKFLPQLGQGGNPPPLDPRANFFSGWFFYFADVILIRVGWPFRGGLLIAPNLLVG